MLSICVQGIGHPSTSPALQTIRPGTRRRVDVSAQPASALAFRPMSAHPSTILAPLRFRSLGHSVEMTGFEPVTFALQRRCSPAELHPQDLLGLVGLTGFEPVTPVLSGLCSNQLSYKPRVRT
jgi:hypothetical protein